MNNSFEELEQLLQADNHSRATQGLRVDAKNLRQQFGSRRILDSLNLSIKPGEFVVVVGKSGCGKSTLMRLLAQLDSPAAGLLEFGELTPKQAKTATRVMFQDARLLPWKSVISNVSLGLPAEQQGQAKRLLKEVGLEERAHDWPVKLSGGQRQRVALARALVQSPRLLVLDEPLGALDALTRIDMQQLLETLWLSRGFTALLVTHDVSEAVALADRVLIIDQGHVILEQSINLPRPRVRGSAELAALEASLLTQLLTRH